MKRKTIHKSFWGLYIVLLGVSIPHSAYVFASFTDNSFMEVLFSYFIAAMIDVSIFIASYAIYQLDKSKQKHKAAKAGLYAWILSCVAFSWLANSTHAAHYENLSMLSGAKGVPFFEFFIYIFSAFPLLLFIYPAVARIATRNYANEDVIDPRTIEEIQEAALKKAAQLRADNLLKTTIAEINGDATKNILKSGIGGFIGGIKDGVKEGFAKKEEVVEEPKIKTTPLEEVMQEAEEMLESPILQAMEEKENGVPIGDEHMELWSEVKKVNAKDVKFSTRKPYFRTPNDLLFMNVSQAYQNEKDGNIYSPHITKDFLLRVIDGRRIDARFIRYVETTAFGNESVSKTILIHPDVLKILLELANVKEETSEQVPDETENDTANNEEFID